MACVWCVNNDQSIVELAEHQEASSAQAMEEGKAGHQQLENTSQGNELAAEEPSQSSVPLHEVKTEEPAEVFEVDAEPAKPPPPAQVVPPQVPQTKPAPVPPAPAPKPATPGPAHTHTGASRQKPAAPTNCVAKWWYGLIQQHETAIPVPVYTYRPPVQTCCGLFCTLLFIIVGAILVSASSTIPEVIVSYSGKDLEKTFTVPTDITGDVLVWYELPQVMMNNKRFVENKDSSVYPTLLSKVICDSAKDIDEIRWRREGDAKFLAMLSNLQEFRPCGLVALSVFTDTYEVFRFSSPNWQRQAIDESNILLPQDDKIFSSRITPVSNTDPNATSNLTVAGVGSWLPSGSFFDHFKVWYRTPASPHVRNLWGTIKGGMSAGTYKVTFPENSPVWTERWGVPEKRIIFSRSHALGSTGAVKLLGAFMLALGVTEALVLVTIAGFWALQLTRKS